MQTNLTVYALGATQFRFTSGVAFEFVPGPNVNGFIITSFGQTTFMGGPSMAGATILSSAFLFPAAPINIEGPAKFYASGAAATNTINVLLKYSDNINGI